MSVQKTKCPVCGRKVRVKRGTIAQHSSTRSGSPYRLVCSAAGRRTTP